MTPTWVAVLTELPDVSSQSDSWLRSDYGAVAYNLPVDAGVDICCEQLIAVHELTQLDTWPLVGDDCLRSMTEGERSILLRCVASISKIPTLVLESRATNSELQPLIGSWLQQASRENLAVRVCVGRSVMQEAPDGTDRVEWFDLLEAESAVSLEKIQSKFSKALRWVVDRLELMQRSPSASHWSIYLDSKVESSAPVAALTRYWANETKIVASNNPGVLDRLIFVRGNCRLLPIVCGESSSTLETQPAQAMRLPSRPTPLPLIAVVVHLHYPELWTQFAAALSSITSDFDLFVSTEASIEQSVGSVVRASYPRAYVFGLENRGRDVWPFFATHDRFDLLRYQFVCKLHTKRSHHVDGTAVLPIAVSDGNDWRNQLLHGLIGSAEIVRLILEKFDDPTVGMVCPSKFAKSIETGTAGSTRRLEEVMCRLHLSMPHSAMFAAGTMFWVRTKAIEALLNANFRATDFEGERGQVDYTMHHAVERLFGMVVSASGYELVNVDVPVM